MSTARKVLLIAATALVVAGIALAGTAFALAGGDLRNLSNDNRLWEHHIVEISAEDTAALTALMVSDTQDIRIEGYGGDTIRVEYWDHQQRGVDIAPDGTTLNVNASETQRLQLFGVLLSYPEDHATYVQVPQDFDGSIGVYGTDGDASVARFEHLDEVNICSQNGRAVANAFGARMVQVESENSLVQADIVTADEDVSATSVNGDVVLDSICADNVRAYSENGSVSASSITATTLVSAQASNGSVDLFRTDAPLTETASNNGDIALTLPGSDSDYRVDASAVNGVVENPALTPREGDRQVTARTVNGNIKVSYEGSDLKAGGRLYRGEALTWLLAQLSNDAGQVAGSGEQLEGSAAPTEPAENADTVAASPSSAAPSAAASPANAAAPASPASPSAPAAPAEPNTPAESSSAAAQEQEPAAAPTIFIRGFDAFMKFFNWVV